VQNGNAAATKSRPDEIAERVEAGTLTEPGRHRPEHRIGDRGRARHQPERLAARGGAPAPDAGRSRACALYAAISTPTRLVRRRSPIEEMAFTAIEL
jgi:hypothetical protein